MILLKYSVISACSVSSSVVLPTSAEQHGQCRRAHHHGQVGAAPRAMHSNCMLSPPVAEAYPKPTRTDVYLETGRTDTNVPAKNDSAVGSREHQWGSKARHLRAVLNDGSIQSPKYKSERCASVTCTHEHVRKGTGTRTSGALELSKSWRLLALLLRSLPAETQRG